MWKDDPEYHLACVDHAALVEILSGWEEFGPMFAAYFRQEERERLNYGAYCYEWGRDMGRRICGREPLAPAPELPPRLAHPQRLDRISREQGGLLRRLWRRCEEAARRCRIYEGAYLTTLGVKDGERT